MSQQRVMELQHDVHLSASWLDAEVIIPVCHANAAIEQPTKTRCPSMSLYDPQENPCNRGSLCSFIGQI